MNENKPMTREAAMLAARAVARLRQLNASVIATRDSDTEKETCTRIVNNTVIHHADELLGTWLTMHNEYTPLVQGMAGLLKRAVAINEQEQFARAQAQAQRKANVDAANAKAETATKAPDAEATAASVTQGEPSPAAEELPAGKRIVVHFGEAEKTGAPVEPAEPIQGDAPTS